MISLSVFSFSASYSGHDIYDFDPSQKYYNTHVLIPQLIVYKKLHVLNERLIAFYSSEQICQSAKHFGSGNALK